MKTYLAAAIASMLCLNALPAGTEDDDPFATPAAQRSKPAKQEDDNPFVAGEKLPPQVRVSVEFIEMSHTQLTGLLFGDEAFPDDSALRKRVAELIGDGKASVMETLLCTAFDGQKATTESIEEYIYATEYEPAEIATKLQFKDAKEAQAAKASPGDFATGPTPTAFETRNLGSTLEIEPKVMGDGSVIRLRFLPEIVYHAGNEVWAEWKGVYGDSPIQMPKFYKISLTTTVALAPGKTMLAGVLSPKDDKGKPDPSRKLMVFVKAVILPAGK